MENGKLEKTKTIASPYHHYPTWKALLWITFACLLIVFGFNAFVLPAGIIPAGTAGIAQTILQILNRVVVVGQNQGSADLSPSSTLGGIPEEALFYMFWIVINIPLVIFGFIKVGKKFTFLTLYFMILQSSWGIAWTFIPGLQDVTVITVSSGANVLENAAADAERVIAGVLGAFFVGIPIGITFFAGSSAGGTDFVAAYLSRKKNTSVGKFNTILNLAVVVFGVFILYVVLEAVYNDRFFEVFSSEVAATVVFILITSFLIDKIYPINKKLSLQVITTKEQIDPIERKLEKAGYIRSYTVLPCTTGKNKANQVLLLFTISFLEREFVLEKITSVDPTAFITYTQNLGVSGFFKRTRT